MTKKKTTDTDLGGEFKKRKAVGLLSGGLDSTLAHRVIVGEGYEVIAINYETPFCNCGNNNTCTTARKNVKENVEHRRFFAGPEYIEIVKKPKYGHGKHMNICIDCRLYMLKKAKEVMESENADFVFTGEVLYQRPMSQRRDSLELIERESGLVGRLLRPLSAKKLRATIPEKEGMINRDRLYGFHGRNRTPQMNLAEKFGIEKYPSPAGGCLLTDEHYSRLLKDAFDHGEDSMIVLQLMKHGRHYRMEDGTRMVCGRTEKENNTLRSMCDESTGVVTVKGAKSAYVFIWGTVSGDNRECAGKIAARYSKEKDRDSVDIKWWIGRNGESKYKTFTVSTESDEYINRFKI
ncbi:hypothetical protein ACFL6I_22335 [candidate division KSB1 bacterium]